MTIDLDILKKDEAKQVVKGFLREWDPIDVYALSVDWPEDEYDLYVSQVLELLNNDVSEKELEQHLTKLADEVMGSPAPEESRDAARKIINYWTTLTLTDG